MRHHVRVGGAPRLVTFALALIACAGSGCVLGPDYVRPTVEVPAAYRFGDQAYMVSGAIDQYAWWNSLGDPVLDGLIRETLANNRDLRIATARVDEFAAILAAYGATYGYTRYPDANHVLTFDRAFTDMTLYGWLLAQKREKS